MEDTSKKAGSQLVNSSVVGIATESTPKDNLLQKEPWQMTKAEYEALHGKGRGNATVSGRFSQHKSAVEIAINRGLPVPPEVLQDYPSLYSAE